MLQALLHSLEYVPGLIAAWGSFEGLLHCAKQQKSAFVNHVSHSVFIPPCSCDILDNLLTKGVKLCFLSWLTSSSPLGQVMTVKGLLQNKRGLSQKCCWIDCEN